MTALPHRAFPVVLAAPSGTGKTTIARVLVSSEPEFAFSVSVTTRPVRPGEREGIDYHFVDRWAFESMARLGELAEWAEVHGHLYGTPLRNLEEAAGRGRHVVLDIDVQGARQIRERVPDALLVFVFPPSAEALFGRLTGRGTEGTEDVARRLRNARGELEALEAFDYVVVNDDLERAVRQVRGIVRAEGHRPARALDIARDVGRMQDDIDRILGARFTLPGRGTDTDHRSTREEGDG